MTDLDFTAHYQVTGYRGIAFYLKSYATETVPEDYILECSGQCEADNIGVTELNEAGHLAECYVYQEPEQAENRDQVIAVMVGDDAEHVFDVDDLTRIKEDEFCRDCGQVGCTSNTYE